MGAVACATVGSVARATVGVRLLGRNPRGELRQTSYEVETPSERAKNVWCGAPTGASTRPTLPRSSWARALALAGLAVLLLVQTLSLVSRPMVKEAPPEVERMAAEEQPQQIHRSYATKGSNSGLAEPTQSARYSQRVFLALDRTHRTWKRRLVIRGAAAVRIAPPSSVTTKSDY